MLLIPVNHISPRKETEKAAAKTSAANIWLHHIAPCRDFVWKLVQESVGFYSGVFRMATSLPVGVFKNQSKANLDLSRLLSWPRAMVAARRNSDSWWSRGLPQRLFSGSFSPSWCLWDLIPVTPETFSWDFKTRFITTARYLALAASLGAETQYPQTVTC